MLTPNRIRRSFFAKLVGYFRDTAKPPKDLTNTDLSLAKASLLTQFNTARKSLDLPAMTACPDLDAIAQSSADEIASGGRTPAPGRPDVLYVKSWLPNETLTNVSIDLFEYRDDVGFIFKPFISVGFGIARDANGATHIVVEFDDE